MICKSVLIKVITELRPTSTFVPTYILEPRYEGSKIKEICLPGEFGISSLRQINQTDIALTILNFRLILIINIIQDVLSDFSSLNDT